MSRPTRLSRLIVRLLPFVPRSLVRQVADPYIAGETLDDAAATVKNLNARGAMATIDILGEDILDAAMATRAAEAYLEVLDRIDADGLDANISIKPTQFGLKIGEDLCFRNIERVVQRAAESNNFVRIDMEDTSCTTATLRLFRRLRASYDNVGVVLQAYLRRTAGDVQALADLTPNYRLCKGIYIEPRALAYKDPEIVNRNFVKLLADMLDRGSYVGIATHDERLVHEAEWILRSRNLSRDAFEFQMLLGVDEALGRILLDAGHRLRVYVPFGTHWYAYSLRRLKENPNIAGYVFWDTVESLRGSLSGRRRLPTRGAS